MNDGTAFEGARDKPDTMRSGSAATARNVVDGLRTIETGGRSKCTKIMQSFRFTQQQQPLQLAMAESATQGGMAVGGNGTPVRKDRRKRSCMTDGTASAGARDRPESMRGAISHSQTNTAQALQAIANPHGGLVQTRLPKPVAGLAPKAPPPLPRKNKKPEGMQSFKRSFKAAKALSGSTNSPGTPGTPGSLQPLSASHSSPSRPSSPQKPCVRI